LPDRPVLDLPTPEGWKAELTYFQVDVGEQSEGSLSLILTTTGINMKEPQPHDSQNQII